MHYLYILLKIGLTSALPKREKVGDQNFRKDVSRKVWNLWSPTCLLNFHGILVSAQDLFKTRSLTSFEQKKVGTRSPTAGKVVNRNKTETRCRVADLSRLVVQTCW